MGAGPGQPVTLLTWCPCAGGRGVWAALQEVFSAQHGERVRSTSTVRKLAALTAQQRLKVMVYVQQASLACTKLPMHPVTTRLQRQQGHKCRL